MALAAAGLMLVAMTHIGVHRTICLLCHLRMNEAVGSFRLCGRALMLPLFAGQCPLQGWGHVAAKVLSAGRWAFCFCGIGDDGLFGALGFIAMAQALAGLFIGLFSLR